MKTFNSIPERELCTVTSIDTQYNQACKQWQITGAKCISFFASLCNLEDASLNQIPITDCIPSYLPMFITEVLDAK